MASGVSKRQKRGRDSTSKAAPTPRFDSTRFVSKEAQYYFDNVLAREKLIDSLFFDFASLRSVGLDVEPKFNAVGIGSFVSTLFPIHETFVREFYANLTHEVNESGELVIRSRANKKNITFAESELHTWFQLKKVGYRCTGSFKEQANGEGYATDPSMRCDENSNKSYAITWLKEKSHILPPENQLDCNAFGIEMRMLHCALTRTVTPKVHTQIVLRGRDLEIMYYILKENQVNFCFVVMSYMIDKAVFMFKKDYKAEERERKSGIPYGAILTHIFAKCGVNLSSSKGVKVHKNQIVKDSYLRTMKIYRTLNHGWVFYKQIGDEELMHDGTTFRVQTPGPPSIPGQRYRAACPSTPSSSQAAGSFAPPPFDPSWRDRLTALEDQMATHHAALKKVSIEVATGFASIRTMIKNVASKVGCEVNDPMEEDPSKDLVTSRRRSCTPP